jgi:hypothetical protein
VYQFVKSPDTPDFFRLFHAFHVSKSPVEQRLVSEALHPLPQRE